MLTLSNVFKRNYKAFKDDDIRYIINRGGSSSSKTFSLLQLLVAIVDKYDLRIDVVGLSVPHLKSGVLNDMPLVCQGYGINFYNRYLQSEKIYSGEKGKIHFISVDKLGKAHGGRRDILFLNEANHLPYKIAEQLIIRTRKKIFIDFNPTSKFWAQFEIQEKEPEKTCEIISTYKDNPFLEKSIIDTIEAKRHNENFWRVYALGEFGFTEGLIFSNWEVKDFDKESFKSYRHGLDFGFSNDPLAYVRLAIDKSRKEIYVCDEIYQTGLLNEEAKDKIKPFVNYSTLYCDSAEPKSIAEFQKLGLNARACKKGAGSVESGIKYLQEYKIFIHLSCPNMKKEAETYRWVEDKKTGDFLPEPEDSNNHLWDAIRYSLTNDIGRKQGAIY